ncbi:unnamed protein product [Prorocentrum cordatum]|uniref:Uncharacterized protein n=1 Tax=Prorocentrum cordatum TaxID=2364126 RepID=A0ABN9Q9C3_9DINO|nr:unnamed protein product [Polarella glacialis]
MKSSILGRGVEGRILVNNALELEGPAPDLEVQNSTFGCRKCRLEWLGPSEYFATGRYPSRRAEAEAKAARGAESECTEAWSNVNVKAVVESEDMRKDTSATSTTKRVEGGRVRKPAATSSDGPQMGDECHEREGVWREMARTIIRVCQAPVVGPPLHLRGVGRHPLCC